jgi:hypothetical protein
MASAVSACHAAWPWSRLSGRHSGAPVLVSRFTAIAAPPAMTAVTGGQRTERRRHASGIVAANTTIDPSCAKPAPGVIGPW